MNSEKQRAHALLLAVWCFVLFCLVFAAGYGLSYLLFKFTGNPPALPAHIISGLLGMLALGLCAFCIKLVSRAIQLHGEHDGHNGHNGHNRHNQGFAPRMLNNMLEAIERIAQGDFTVLIPIGKHDPYSELAESVNKMARQLGSMENVRQEFISNVSHEIQSPLTSISGFAALLRNDALPAAQRHHYITVIETESKRLSALSENLLKLSALEVGGEGLAVKEYRLDKQLENIALMLEPQWSAKNILMEAQLGKLTVYGDEGLLAQVWINLLHNAIKFTPEGGGIHIFLSAEETEINCRIADTGIGITPEDRIHIFERFYKADKARASALGGNGLGLALVKKIVELHGGTIGLQSEPGGGTVFTVKLPQK